MIKTKLFIANLPENMGRDEVYEFFDGFHVSRIWLHPNGRRFGFVTVDGHQEAERAIEELSGKVYMGRKIYVAMSTDNPRQQHVQLPSGVPMRGIERNDHGQNVEHYAHANAKVHQVQQPQEVPVRGINRIAIYIGVCAAVIIAVLLLATFGIFIYHLARYR